MARNKSNKIQRFKSIAWYVIDPLNKYDNGDINLKFGSFLKHLFKLTKIPAKPTLIKINPPQNNSYDCGFYAIAALEQFDLYCAKLANQQQKGKEFDLNKNPFRLDITRNQITQRRKNLTDTINEFYHTIFLDKEKQKTKIINEYTDTKTDDDDTSIAIINDNNDSKTDIMIHQ